MSAELLVNATPPETRVALREEGRTVEVFHERRGRESLVGIVYLAVAVSMLRERIGKLEGKLEGKAEEEQRERDRRHD